MPTTKAKIAAFKKSLQALQRSLAHPDLTPALASKISSQIADTIARLGKLEAGTEGRPKKDCKVLEVYRDKDGSQFVEWRILGETTKVRIPVEKDAPLLSRKEARLKTEAFAKDLLQQRQKYTKVWVEPKAQTPCRYCGKLCDGLCPNPECNPLL